MFRDEVSSLQPILDDEGFIDADPGKPIAKKRPRFARIGKFVRTYDPQETEEGLFLFHLRQQWEGEPMDGPIILEATFIMPIPKGFSKKKRALLENKKIHHTKKPDLDNLIKFIKDCLNGFVWKDDSQIFNIVANKRYGDPPMTLDSLRSNRIFVMYFYCHQLA